MSGYASSGRFRADIERDRAIRERRLAHSCFRFGLLFEGNQHMRRALRAWRQFRFFKSQIREN